MNTQANQNRRRICIGIDPGTKTGIAIWNATAQKFISLDTVLIHEALDHVRLYHNLPDVTLAVVVEDARQARFWSGADARAQQQGAGSVKRDASIWEDFLKQEKIAHQMVRPRKAITKLSAEDFKRITGWTDRTSSHARDAGMLVFQR